MHCLGKSAQIFNYAESVDSRDNHSGDVSGSKSADNPLLVGNPADMRNDSKCKAVIFCIRFHHLDNLRQQCFRQEHLRFPFRACKHHHRGFGSRCRAVVHGSIGTIHSRQLRHHRLILEDIAESTLRHFRLIRSICRKIF